MTRHPFRWSSLVFGLVFLAGVGQWAVWKQDWLTPRELSLTSSGVLIGTRPPRRRRDVLEAHSSSPPQPRLWKTTPPRKEVNMKKLTRNPDDKWLGGVCGGLADYTGIDANLIRLVVAVCTLLGAGSLILAYIVAWVLMPARPGGSPDRMGRGH